MTDDQPTGDGLRGMFPEATAMQSGPWEYDELGVPINPAGGWFTGPPPTTRMKIQAYGAGLVCSVWMLVALGLWLARGAHLAELRSNGVTTALIAGLIGFACVGLFELWMLVWRRRELAARAKAADESAAP